ncbi:hypothetical protein [Botrimarina mediterranea]|uniref:Uncharacterized protein n=1 Tax=Botrimarina mediterranea TaxID=2528022 RepID=A0A518K7F2_9BACT|nr:hypothetical protein [Botrimarina mediterranea]QDV73728.1 hypothetical protein Spa11_19270 [Botrimarina mediterranea]
MRTTVPEKLLKIADDISETGSANLTRLTVLKKWFETPGRLGPFAIWVADRATSRRGKTKGEAGKLFRDARALLTDLDRVEPTINAEAAELLHAKLVAYQDDYRTDRWGRIRIVNNWQLLLIEKGLAIALSRRPHPSEGYKLAAAYCQHYDPKYGNTLNGPSGTKIHEIVRWMFTHEALEEVKESLER